MGYWDEKEKKPIEEEPEHISLEQLEQDCIEELGEVENSFRERMQNENKRFRDMCDTEYWFCVCFTSRAQKEELLKSIGFDTDLKYIEGKEFAKAVNRALKTPDLKFARIGKGSKDYLDRVKQD